MAATTYGGGTYGTPDESGTVPGLGLHVAELRGEESVEEAFAKNNEGEDIGVGLYNRQYSMTGRGVTVTANTIPGAVIATEIDLADTNIIPTGLEEIWIQRSELTNTNTDFQEGAFTGNSRIGITIP